MSLLGQLKPNKGSTHKPKVLGRGRGSGLGGTSGKGHKGQTARSGGKIRWGFEGGQMPLARRTPKVGFTNAVFRDRYTVVNLRDLEKKMSGDVNPESLAACGLVGKKAKVKILAHGELTKALNVKVHKLSAKAKEAIEKAGGTVEVI